MIIHTEKMTIAYIHYILYIHGFFTLWTEQYIHYIHGEFLLFFVLFIIYSINISRVMSSFKINPPSLYFARQILFPILFPYYQRLNNFRLQFWVDWFALRVLRNSTNKNKIVIQSVSNHAIVIIAKSCNYNQEVCIFGYCNSTWHVGFVRVCSCIYRLYSTHRSLAFHGILQLR